MTQSGSGNGAGTGKRADAHQADISQHGLFDNVGQRIDAARSHIPDPVHAPQTSLSVTNNAPKSKRPSPATDDDKAGHRQRLLDRFRDGGADAMPDYELLEMILFRAIPRGDTKPLAKALLSKFKNFSEIMNAPDDRLKEVTGIGQRAVDEIKVVRAAALRMLQKQLLNREVLSTWTAVLEYCKAVQGHDEIERFRILFLDKRNQLILDEVQQSGTVDHTPVYVREIIKRALQLGATALVLVHNHPSGDPSPSRADVEMTKQIVDAARPLGVTVHDHIIVGRNGHFSFRSSKMI